MGAKRKRKRLEYEVINEDWGEQTWTEDTTPSGSSKDEMEPTADKGATAANKGAAQVTPPPPCENKGGGMESSITILEAPGSQVSRPLLKQRIQASIKMFTVPRPPEPAGTMLRSEEGLDQTEHDITFVNRAEEDMRAEEYEEKKDRAEDTPTSSSVPKITLEEE